jgi:hypothetical protein
MELHSGNCLAEAKAIAGFQERSLLCQFALFLSRHQLAGTVDRKQAKTLKSAASVFAQPGKRLFRLAGAARVFM